MSVSLTFIYQLQQIRENMIFVLLELPYFIKHDGLQLHPLAKDKTAFYFAIKEHFLVDSSILNASIPCLQCRHTIPDRCLKFYLFHFQYSFLIMCLGRQQTMVQAALHHVGDQHKIPGTQLQSGPGYCNHCGMSQENGRFPLSPHPDNSSLF